MRNQSLGIFSALLIAVCLNSVASAAVRIDWDRNTLALLQEGGVYGRMTRVADGLLCCFEHNGACWVRHSSDDGKTWKDAVKAAEFAFGNAANPDLLHCKDGRVILLFNQRPNDHVHPFAIAMAVSRDNGSSWTSVPKPLYEAGPAEGGGCYEPSAIQLPSGEIQLFFANEFPHRTDGSQEITLMKSRNDGTSWDKPRAVSYRAGHRDGMPVPVLLLNQKGIAFVIEDNGITADHQFKPSIIHSPLPLAWSYDAIGSDSKQRWSAVDGDWPAHVYAGAPYLRQLPTGETILSCQYAQDGKVPQMAVYIGDSDAKHFSNPSFPFPIGDQTRGMWNSLFVKGEDVVAAISSTRIDGVRGVWAIDGHVVREGK